GGARVLSVELVQVDVVRAEALQAVIDRVEDVLPRVAAVPAVRPHVAEALGREDEVLALPLEPAPQDLLRASGRGHVPAEGIRVRGVEEGDAALGSAVEDRARGVLVALQAEGHGPEAQPRDLQAGPAETHVFHRSSSRMLPGRSADRANESTSEAVVSRLSGCVGRVPEPAQGPRGDVTCRTRGWANLRQRKT